MKTFVRYLWVAAIVAPLVLACSGIVDAAEGAGQVSLSLMPVRFVQVNGDVQKFRSLEWMNDGYSWGVEGLSIEKKFNKDIDVSLEASGIPSANDANADILIKKEGKGFVHLNYQLFRKYYDDGGGFYKPFTTLADNHAGQDLHLDMGRLELEMGTAPEGERGIIFSYEHEMKEGTKSRLTWTSVKEGATTRKIGPSTQKIDEAVDVVAVKGQTEMAGFSVNAEQRAEFIKSANLREERNLSTTTGTTDTKFRQQLQEPTTHLYTSTLRASRWMLNDRSYVALGYRQEHLNNSEDENIREYADNGQLYNYSNSENKLNAFADNDYDNNIWNGHYIYNATDHVSLIAKFKAEAIKRRGDSTYPSDSTAPYPDGVIDRTEVSHVENAINRTGENFGLRFTGLPRTSVYAEADLEQTRNWLTEERNSIAGQSASSAGEIFARETLTHGRKNGWTVGSRSVPSRWLTFTAHLRQQYTDDDYDDLSETVYTTGAKSSFSDAMRMRSDEGTTRVAWKPFSWIETGIRYQYLGTKYRPRAENQDYTKSWSDSNTFTYDTTVIPSDNLYLNLSYSRQLYKMSTPAASSGTASITPGFTSNVDSWLFGMSYVVKSNLSLSNSILYSQADNFNDFSTIGLPLGVSNKRYDLTTGLKWEPKAGLAVEPHYSYVFYKSNPLSEVSDYNAHVTWLDVKLTW